MTLTYRELHSYFDFFSLHNFHYLLVNIYSVNIIKPIRIMCFSCGENETVVRILNPVDGSVLVIVVTPRPQAETGNPTENDGKAMRYFMQYFTNRCYTDTP